MTQNARSGAKITLEEHFVTQYFLEHEDSIVAAFRPDFAEWRGLRIKDLADLRLQDMDDNGIEMQVLSLTTPGIEGIQDADEAVYQAKKVNDFLAGAIQDHPTRFSGFASIPCQRPQEAADELERSVTQLGLKGALINGNIAGEYLDEEKFWVIWERAEQLGVPIYLHPGSSPDEWQVARGYPELQKAMWGWGCETATHALRIILSGVFDTFPKANLILGHMGEMLPFMATRLDNRWSVSRQSTVAGLAKRPSEYITENLMVTTSGVCSPQAFLCTQLVMGVDRIMFSVDYPYESVEEAVQFIDTVPLSSADREKICRNNAKKLLNL